MRLIYSSRVAAKEKQTCRKHPKPGDFSRQRHSWQSHLLLHLAGRKQVWKPTKGKRLRFKHAILCYTHSKDWMPGTITEQ